MPIRLGKDVLPVLSSAPGSPTTGQQYYNSTDGASYVYSGSAWQKMSKHVFRTTHTWTIPDAIAVPSGDTDFIPPFFISLATGQTANVVKARYIISSGTSATVKIQKNGADLTGYTGISVTSTAASTTSTQSVADDDRLALVVTAVSGSPKNLSLTLVLEHTVI